MKADCEWDKAEVEAEKDPRKKQMEAPFERQEVDDEVIGMELDTTSRSKRSHLINNNNNNNTKPVSPTVSDTSSCVSNESSNDYNLDYFVKFGNGNGNGESHTLVEEVIPEVVVEQEEEEEEEEEEESVVKVEPFAEEEIQIQASQNQGANGVSVHQNGNNSVYSLHGSNVRNKETDFGSNGSTFSKSPDTAIGLKYLESLLDGNSNAENGITSHNRNADVSQAPEIEPEGEEYDVERVIQKQETHDLYCPNCRSCITKRVILRRRKRKRKIQDISTAEEGFGLGPDQSGLPAASDDIGEESQQPLETGGVLDSRLDAISCFSCFNIFVPSGEGFLCWRFKPKAAVTRQPDGTLIDTDFTTDRTGSIFPLWIVTCCQPAERKKSDETVVSPPGLAYTPLSGQDTVGQPSQTNPIFQPSEDIPVSSTPGILVAEQGTYLPHIERPQHGPEATLQTKPLNPIKPYGDQPSYNTPSNTTTDQGSNFPLWILTCCQPSTGGTELHHQTKPDGSAPSLEPPPATFGKREADHPVKPDGSTPPRKIPSGPYGNTESDHLGKPDGTSSQREPPSESSGNVGYPFTSYHDPVPTFNPKSPTIFVPDQPSYNTPLNTTTDQGSSFPLWILTCCQPSTGGTKLDHQTNLDGTAPSLEPPSATFGKTADHPVKPDRSTPSREISSGPSGSTESAYLGKPASRPSVYADGTPSQSQPPSDATGNVGYPFTSYDDNPLPTFNPKSPTIFVPGTSSPYKPITLINPNDIVPLPPQTESPAAPGNYNIPGVSTMPHKPQTQIVLSGTSGPDTLVDVEPGLALARESPRRGVAGLDIVKAIVYGGLLESITSLSVITSAAGGDATTLNIVALGLANVFGGLVVLVHNLRVLKHEHTTERYQNQLGQPGHYMLHAIVAILSYLIFGLMSPLIYGFSFRESDDKDFKLATLASAALLSITILSAAKAYVRIPPKGYFKTVFYYISLGFMVSGLGYVAGDVINMLLKKFGIFDPKASGNVPVMAIAGGVWSSY